MHSTNPAVSVAAHAVSLTLLQGLFPVQLRTAWRRFRSNERTIAPAAARRIRVTPPLQSPLVNRPQRKESHMRTAVITKMASILAANLILGSVSIASAAAIHKPVRRYHNHRVIVPFYRQANDVFANF